MSEKPTCKHRVLSPESTPKFSTPPTNSGSTGQAQPATT